MLHTEGPVKGSITLTIARRAHSPALGNNHDRYNSSHLNNNSGIYFIYIISLNLTKYCCNIPLNKLNVGFYGN